MEEEIKRFTERLYNETFGNGQGTLDEFDWEDIATVIEETAHHFVNWQKEHQLHWKPSEVCYGAKGDPDPAGVWKPSEQKYDGNMDKECIKLCDILNSVPSIDTFESCCGHLRDRYSIWFFCNDIITISRLGRCVERNYSDGKWELLVDSTDTHPTGVFWLRSKEPFQSYDEMEKSVNGLCNCIQYWFNMKEETTKKEEHWKPSEEQMEILGKFNDPVLKSLYEQLKKLKGGVAPMRDIDE